MARLKQRFRTVDDRKILTGHCAVFYDPDRLPTERSVSLRTKNPRHARVLLSRLEDDYFHGRFDPWKDKAAVETLTVAAAAERYIQSRKGRKTASTVRSDELALRTLCTFLPAMPVAQVSRQHIEKFMDRRRKKGCSNATQHTYFTRIRHFFGWCVKEGLRQDDPTAGMEKPRLQSKAKAVFTREQLEHLHSFIIEDASRREGTIKEGEVRWLADVIAVAVSTGMRLSELCHMRWSWVSFDHSEITIRSTGVFRPKSGHERVIPITGRALEVLSRLYRESAREASSFVFTSRRGRRGDAEHLDPLYVSRRFREYRKMAGLPDGLRFHSLRHTYCTWLCAAEVPVPVVQRLAGHADITTTMGYVHVAGNDLHRAVQKVF